MNTQQIHIIKLEKGQYLNDIEPFKSTGIPSNSVLHKTVTGCGITTSELKHTKRNSIIILPNVPVIEGKVKEHNAKCGPKEKVLAVYKGVEMEDIQDYLNSEAIYKKILITPEGFNTKLIKCIEDGNPEIPNTYFLLYDECERIITDVGYRKAIAAPADWFFKFTNKALVSATILPFNDKRFEAFDHYVIEPTYDYSKPIKLIETNNVLQSLKQHIERLKSDHVSVFLNSTDAIYAVITSLKIEKESIVYCARESVAKLRAKGNIRAYEKIDSKAISKFTFFTSRFYSAVDIIVDYKPDVVLVTDLTMTAFNKPAYTRFDPWTDVIQISGRYRNGISSLTHISNFDTRLVSRTPENAIAYLDGCFDTYDKFVTDHQQATNEGSKDTLKSAIKCSLADRFYFEGKRNSFMVDNFIHEERVKGYYQSFSNLLSAYADRSKHFVTSHIQDVFATGDFEMLSRKSMTGKVLNEHMARKLHELSPGGKYYLTMGHEGEINYIREKHPLIYKAYHLLGFDQLIATGLTASALKQAISAREYQNQMRAISTDVYKVIQDGEIACQSIPSILQPIYDSYGYNRVAKQADASIFFEIQRTTKDKVKSAKLGRRLF